MSSKVGSMLQRIKIQSSNTITDAGLHVLLSKAKVVEHVHLEDLPKVQTGEFLCDLFQGCPALHTVHLSSMSSLNWGMCKIAAQGWPELSIKKLHVRGVNLDVEFGFILAKMSNLNELEIDGPARNITSASLSW